MTILATAIATAAAISIKDTTTCEKGPCRPGNDRCAQHVSTKYVFHLSDDTCAINDPNGPFYDAVHGMYHNFYQDHLAEPQHDLGPGRGPDWGHWVSRDFLHWTRLPVAIWNDKWYDAVAIYSGSTTIVDGKPVIIYPGLCKKGLNGCTGTDYVAAVPANSSDPFYTEWVKEGPQMGGLVNPIVNHTGDDPSTAWQTSSGEWRLIGNQGCSGGAPIYGSKDFIAWYKIGCTQLRLGDCPTFFPLPPLTPGSDVALTDEDRASLPNWVHKAGSGNDQVQVGMWTDGKPGPEGVGTPGTWVQRGGSIPLDNGKTHASKDFWDPVKKRRIMWVWGTLPSGLQTIPRDMTYDPRTNKINYAPVEEMESLRTKSLGSLGPETTATALPASSACDIEVQFKRPTVTTTVSVHTTGGTFFMNYTAGDTVQVGFAATPSNLAANLETSAGSDKGTGMVDTVTMLASDTAISFRIFLDTNVGEVYFMGGRVAMTVQIPTSAYSVTVMASKAAPLITAKSWQMGSIWVTKDEVLATPRLDGKN